MGLPWWSSDLRLHAPNAGGTGSIPGQGTKIPHAAWRTQKKKKKVSIYSLLFSLLPPFGKPLARSGPKEEG